MKNAGAWLQGLFFIAGLAILYATLRSTDFSALRDQARAGNLTWASLLALGIHPFTTLFNVRGWQIVLPERARGARAFNELFWIRMAGEAFNNVTPFVDIGGEWLKTVLTAARLGISERTAFASVILARTGMFYSELGYWACGFALAGAAPAWSEQRPLFVCVAAAFALIGVAVAVLQKKGLLEFFLAPLKALGIAGGLSARAHKLDAEISVFYR